ELDLGAQWVGNLFGGLCGLGHQCGLSQCTTFVVHPAKVRRPSYKIVAGGQDEGCTNHTVGGEISSFTARRGSGSRAVHPRGVSPTRRWSARRPSDQATR